MNAITGEVAHTPPSFTEINGMLDDLCHFANNNDPDIFVHPIIRGIIIHFILSFIHPFCDGNGRTARSLVYWYLLKNKLLLSDKIQLKEHQKARLLIFSGRVCFLRFPSPLSQKERVEGVSRQLLQVWIPSLFQDG